MKRPLLSEWAKKGWKDLPDDMEYGTQYVMSAGCYPARRFIVTSYAKLGLHLYNLLHGKKLEFSSVEKLFKQGCSACTYSIDLKAKDPETPGSLLPFQSRVHEQDGIQLKLVCDIGRPLGDTKKTKRTRFRQNFMPQLPPENPFIDDTGRFHVLNKSELSRNDDWIRLYVDLAVNMGFRHLIKRDQEPLEILAVAMEIPPVRPIPKKKQNKNSCPPAAPSPFNKGLDAYDAIFYIKYIDRLEDRVGEDVDRLAIVRRILDVECEILRIWGCTQTSRTLQPSKEIAAAVEAPSPLLHNSRSFLLYESN